MINEHDIYAAALWARGHGYALYEPDPGDDYDRVRVGDVGYVEFGRFFRGFNVYYDGDDTINSQNGVPEGFQKLARPEVHHRNPLPGGCISSEHVKAVEIGASLESASLIAPIGAHFRLSCSDNRGAAIVIKDGAHRVDAKRTGDLIQYMRRNRSSWLPFFRDQLGREVALHDIVLVSGCDLTSEWITAVFKDSAQEIEVKAQGGMPSVASFGAKGKWSSRSSTGAIIRNGPLESPDIHQFFPSYLDPGFQSMGVEDFMVQGSSNGEEHSVATFNPGFPTKRYASLQNDSSVPGEGMIRHSSNEGIETSVSKSLSVASPSRNSRGSKFAGRSYNQCIFLRTIRMKDRMKGILPPKVMKGAAEPKPDQFDGDCDSSMGGCSIESDESFELLDMMGNGLQTRTEAYLDEIILDYILSNSRADLAIVDQDSICGNSQIFDGVTSASDLLNRLQRHGPKVEVVADSDINVGRLSHQSSEMEFGEYNAAARLLDVDVELTTVGYPGGSDTPLGMEVSLQNIQNKSRMNGSRLDDALGSILGDTQYMDYAFPLAHDYRDQGQREIAMRDGSWINAQGSSSSVSGSYSSSRTLASVSARDSDITYSPDFPNDTYRGSDRGTSSRAPDPLKVCTNCATTNTPLWRQDPEGKPLCNACGLFFKLHGVVRPLALKTDVIKKRSRAEQGSNNAKKVVKSGHVPRTKSVTTEDPKALSPR